MITFQCPKCNEWLSVSESHAGARETCPHCGNVAAIPLPSAPPPIPPAGSTAQFSPAIRKPAMPDVMKAGLGLYIGSFVAGVLSSVLGPPALREPPSPDAAVGLLVIGILALALAALDVLGFIMGCLGYAWGTILRICLYLPGLFVWAVSMLVTALGAGAGALALSVTAFFADLASLICFVVPPAWDYYRECKAYRTRRAFAGL